jgi:hypothetical protein
MVWRSVVKKTKHILRQRRNNNGMQTLSADLPSSSRPLATWAQMPEVSGLGAIE